jgi:hypothetical protein
MNLGIGERRHHSRRGKYLAQGLKISAYRPLLASNDQDAKLRHWVAAACVVDSSEGGLGVEMFEPLAVGVVVLARGELHSTGWCMSLTAQARVTSCRAVDGGVFRIGFEFQDVTYRALDCDHWQESSPLSPAVIG